MSKANCTETSSVRGACTEVFRVATRDVSSMLSFLEIEAQVADSSPALRPLDIRTRARARAAII
jgi:hypothetical protein